MLAHPDDAPRFREERSKRHHKLYLLEKAYLIKKGWTSSHHKLERVARRRAERKMLGKKGCAAIRELKREFMDSRRREEPSDLHG